MKRLIYIIIIFMAAVSAIVAQDPVAATVNTEPANDSTTATGDNTPSTVNTQRAGRNRHISPVNTAATRTQHFNDPQGDSTRMLERRRQRSMHYHDDQGRTIMVDTVTGEEWVDSTLLPPPPKMIQPLFYGVEIGVNIWDPVMRIFGQSYGLVDFSAALNLHNRYLPTFEAGIGMADKTPSDMNFTYKTPMAPYFKIGADYNFLYNSNPDYRITAGLRYGLSFFKYKLDDVTFDDPYWGQNVAIPFPEQNITAGWLELVLALRVKIYGPISAGWSVRYHAVMHKTKSPVGDPWYIPGYGTTDMPITGTFTIAYNLDFHRRHDNEFGPATDVGSDADALMQNPDSVSTETTSTQSLRQ